MPPTKNAVPSTSSRFESTDPRSVACDRQQQCAKREPAAACAPRAHAEPPSSLDHPTTSALPSALPPRAALVRLVRVLCSQSTSNAAERSGSARQRSSVQAHECVSATAGIAEACVDADALLSAVLLCRGSKSASVVSLSHSACERLRAGIPARMRNTLSPAYVRERVCVWREGGGGGAETVVGSGCSAPESSRAAQRALQRSRR
jgi:hypothetical protein